MTNATLTRSPERQALAAAIGRRTEDEQEQVKLNRAKSQAERDWFAALHSRDDARATLETVKAEAPLRRVRALMDGQRDDGTTEAEAAEALRQAEAALEIAKQTQEATKEHESATQNRRTFSQSRLGEALGRAVQADPATAALVDEYWAVRARYAELRTILALMWSANGLPDAAKHWDCVVDPIKGPAFQTWSDALAALEADADAPLPTSNQEG